MPSLKDVRTLWQSKMGEKLSTTPYRYAYLGDGRGFAASNIFVPGDTGSNILYARSTPQNSHFFTILNRGTVAPTFNLPVVIGYKQDEPRTEQILGVHFGGLGNIASSSVPIIGLHHTTHEWLNPSGGGDAVLSKARQFMPLRVSVVSGFTIQVESSPETITGGFTLSTASTLDLTSLKPASGDLYALVYLTPDGVLSARAGSGIIAGPPSYNVPNYNNIPPLNPGERPLAAISLYAGQTQIHETQALQEIIDLRFATFTPGGVLVGTGTVGTIPKWNSSSSLGDSPLIVDTAMHIAPFGAVATNILQFTGACWVPISAGSAGAILATTTPTLISGSGLAGTSASGARSDHVHQGVATISASGNAPSYGGILFLPGTNASISQSGGSITFYGGSAGGANNSTDTPAGVGASPNAGGASVSAPSNHIHKGILSILAGNGASIETNSAGCATISMAGSGWASAIQLANRGTGITYTNGSLTRFVTAVYAASTTLLAQAQLQFKTGAASPPVNIIAEELSAGVADSQRFAIGGPVLPLEYYTVLDLSQVGASVNLYKWTEYDDYGGAPAAVSPSLAGWISDSYTWTYVSADGPTGVFSVPYDATTILSAGMRIQYTQTTIKYGIITAVGTFSGGVTPITIYGGTDYTTANAAITAPSYSTVKAPFGFPLNPSKWTAEITDTTLGSQASPVSGTWYNLRTISLSIPTGIWLVSYEVMLGADGTAANLDMRVTLSTANNSESDVDFTSAATVNPVAGITIPVFRQKVLSLASKTSYFLNSKVVAASIADLYNRNDLVKLFVRAACAYL